MTIDEVLKAAASDREAGLTSADARRRLRDHGPNVIVASKPTSRWELLLRQFVDPVIYLLLLAIIVSFTVWYIDGTDGWPLDVMAIALILVLNAVVGFGQESRAEAAVAALRDLTRNEATVLRDGQQARIAAAEIVPGDLVLLTGGDVVPTDARLIESAALQVAEATLTGESQPVMKSIDPVDRDAVLGDRSCMVYSGTAVVSGRGRAVAVATGAATEVGRIATLLEETEQEPTPLQQEIDRVGRLLGAAVVFIAVIVVATLIVVDGLRTSEELLAGLLIGVSLAVAAVPEGLPAVLSVVLALGVQRMSRRNALVKRLVSVEALGSATIICSDKTGTLTRNEMVLRRIAVPSGQVEFSGRGYEPSGLLFHKGAELRDPLVEEEVRWALTVAGLASDATLVTDSSGIHALGDPTEAALLAAQPKAGIDPIEVSRRFTRKSETPFSAERKRMSTLQVDEHDPSHLLLMVKGAPDGLLERCDFQRMAGRDVPLTSESRLEWHEIVDKLADDALRTLAVAYRRVEPTDTEGEPEADENALVLLGVLGMIDPPREEAKRAIADARGAGIKVAMITGDHPGTAAKIAGELGISQPGDLVVTGAELEAASAENLASLVAKTSVYARVAPEHKLRIVNALNQRGEVVAMTGDGVNDAPALRAAGIGVAMGVTGTDVSKEAADMILTDDNFATIVAAVNEGRAIFHNIRSFLRYLLSSNIGEVLTVFLGVVGASAIGLTVDGDGVAAPLLAVQILWINLMTDAAPALALGVDPPLPGLMDRSPRRLTDRVIDRRMQAGIAIVGLTMALSTLLMLDLQLPGGFIEGDRDLATARTAAFTVLVLAQLFNTFNARSDTESIMGRFFTNRWLVAAIGLSLLLQVAVVHLAFLNEAFSTVPLTFGDWLLAAALASSVMWVSEIRKFLLRRRTPLADLD